MIWFLLACGAPSPPPSVDSSPPGPPCSSISGTQGVAVVSLVDLDHQVVWPSELPVETVEAAASLAGPDAEGLVFLADHSGRVLRSADGCTWSEVGQLPESARSDIVLDTGGAASARWYDVRWLVDPFHPRLFLDAGPEGLFVSDDGGVSFGRVHAGLDVQGALGFDPADPASLRAEGVLDGRSGLFVSADAGLSWSHVAVDLPGAATRLVLHPGEADTMAALGDGLWLTADAGNSWVQAHDDCDAMLHWHDAGFTVSCPAAGGDGPWRAIYSDDLGATWVDWPLPSDDGLFLRSVVGDGQSLVLGGFGGDFVATALVSSGAGVVRHRLPGLESSLMDVVILGDRAIVSVGIGVPSL